MNSRPATARHRGSHPSWWPCCTEGVSDGREWPPPPPALVLLVGGCNEDTFSISLRWWRKGLGGPGRVAGSTQHLQAHSPKLNIHRFHAPFWHSESAKTLGQRRQIPFSAQFFQISKNIVISHRSSLNKPACSAGALVISWFILSTRAHVLPSAT